MDGRSMETQGYEEEEEEEDEIRVLESDEEAELMKIEEEYEDDDEDFKELGELIPPKVTTWTGADGKIIHGIVVFDDDLFDTKISCHMNVCPICFHAWTSHGKHRICCLPCGHMYGLSCINKCLFQTSSPGKCPECNTLCSYRDVILLYASGVCLSDQHKASSARYFPFTKKAYEEFKINEQGRRSDARKLLPDLKKRMLLVLQERQTLKYQYTDSMAQWDDVNKQLQELEQWAEKLGKPVDELGQAYALKQRQADALKCQTEELEQRYIALEPRANALERRVDALCERMVQYGPRVEFFVQMYKEHLRKIKKTLLCTAAPTCHKN